MTAAKRFWKSVSIDPVEDGFSICLDGRAVKTPAGAMLALPHQGLATAIAAEWDSQTEEINPSTMPMFRFTVTAIDRVTPQREAVIDEISLYGGSDLVCYREAEDQALASRQHEAWQPYLDWFAKTEGVTLEVTSGIMPLRQSDEACRVMRDRVSRHDDFILSGLHTLVTVSGSLLIGLAIAARHVAADEGARAALLDDLWQQEKWGYDAEADQRITAHTGLIGEASRYLGLLNTEEGGSEA
ncbi:MAG: ATP12 family chaperone protein [Candidatus Puniceispirillales bacterium]